MKKIKLALLSLITLMLSSGLQAQQEKSLWLDVRAGINTSLILNQNAYGNGELDYITTLGFTAGPGASYFLTDLWGINASFTWAKIGQNYSGMQNSGDATRKVKLNYIEVPLLAMRKIHGTKQPTWVAFGPEFMFLSSAKQDYHRDNDLSPLPNPIDLKEGITDVKKYYKPVDVALNLSLNKMYDLYENSKLRLLITANMAIGLTDINSKQYQIPNMHDKYAGSHNFYIGIKAGLMYRAFVKEE
ncbi:MAG: outer membrane beta-barrel protein [Bacteroidota bacterium]